MLAIILIAVGPLEPEIRKVAECLSELQALDVNHQARLQTFFVSNTQVVYAYGERSESRHFYLIDGEDVRTLPLGQDVVAYLFQPKLGPPVYVAATACPKCDDGSAGSYVSMAALPSLVLVPDDNAEKKRNRTFAPARGEPYPPQTLASAMVADARQRLASAKTRDAQGWWANAMKTCRRVNALVSDIKKHDK